MFLSAAAAAQQAVCPDPPGNPADGKRVLCEENADSEKNITIRLKDFDIDATGRDIRGLYAWHEGNGGIGIWIDGGKIITNGLYGMGVFAELKGDGRVAIGADGARLETKGGISTGVFGVARGAGALDIDVRDSEILTDGVNSYAVQGLHTGEGALRVRIRGGRLETKSRWTQAVYARRRGTGLLRIETRDADIVTRGLASPPGDPFDLGDGGSHGVLGRIFGGGSGGIEIEVKGGSIATEGSGSAGVLGAHTGASGDIGIALAGGAEVTTAGAGAHGVYTGITGSGAVSAAVGAESSVRATGANASGIRFGRLNTTTGVPERAADRDTDGVYRKQTATVNGTARGGTGDAAGVYLAGGGKVFIGPQGTAGAASGVSVWARDKRDPVSNADPPALYVGFDTGGRGMAEIIGDGWILNDGGVTTIVMNGVALHDADGATGLRAPTNGARDVTLRSEGVRVTDSSKPGEFVTEALAGAADRDFSAADFIEAWAPRAAVYEALPGFLLRLDGGGMAAAGGGADSGSGGRLRTRLSVGRGSVKAASGATVGADSDIDRRESAVGADIPLGMGLSAAVWLRLVSGSADISAPTGGGGADARGRGAAGSLAWHGEGGYFAAVRAAATDYDLDLRSRSRGRLAAGVDAMVVSAGAEAGWRAAFSETADLTLRAWAGRSEARVDAATDAAGARLALADSAQTTAGAGFDLETAGRLEGGELRLSGFAGVAFALDGKTAVRVSGETLRAGADDARAQLALGADWRMAGGLSLAAGLHADGLTAGNRILSASLALRMAF